MGLTIKENILTNNDCYKSGRTITPIGMQLHTIGTGQNTASSLASYWNQPGVSCCVHYCIDAEQENLVYHLLPDNYRSWADGGFGNGNLITVELMESDYMKYTGGASYTITDTAKFKADITRLLFSSLHRNVNSMVGILLQNLLMDYMSFLLMMKDVDLAYLHLM